VLPLAIDRCRRRIEGVAHGAANRDFRTSSTCWPVPVRKKERKPSARGELLPNCSLADHQAVHCAPERGACGMTWAIAGQERRRAGSAALLANADLNEDARWRWNVCRARKPTAALKAALAKGGRRRQARAGHSLRVRGVETPGVPDLRLKPDQEDLGPTCWPLRRQQESLVGMSQRSERVACRMCRCSSRRDVRRTGPAECPPARGIFATSRSAVRPGTACRRTCGRSLLAMR